MHAAPTAHDSATEETSGAPSGREATVDPRIRSAWKSWLSALANDAKAAIAAAFAYESLPSEGRVAWLDALDADAPQIDVPRVALYAPLLAVEADETRRSRIEEALECEEYSGTRQVLSLRGVDEAGGHVCAVITSAYLDFVEVLICRYTPAGGFASAHHDPLCHRDDAPADGTIVHGAVLEPFPLRVVVEELAHAVLADKRQARGSPEALVAFAHLFGPVLDGDVERE